jgi:diguanylate cyclase (GGDEF)-like protein
VNTAGRPPLWFLAVLLGLFVPITLLERSFTAGAGQSVWTPALGIMFGAMVLYGNRWTPVLVATLLGVSAISIATSTHKSPTDWGALTAVVAVLVLGYAIGAELCRRVGLRSHLRRLREAAWLAGGVFLGSAVAIAAVIAVLEPLGYLHGKAWWPTFFHGFASAGASTLAVAPLILLAGDRVTARPRSRRTADVLHPVHMRPSRLRSAGWLIESIVVAGCFAGAADLALAHPSSPVYYPMLLPIGWLAVRRGIGGTSVGVAVGTLALSLFAHSLGLKVSQINQLETFLLVFALCGLCFGAAQTERRDLENQAIEGRRALAAREAQLKSLVQTLQDQANRDTLTHLPLKALFLDYLAQAQARSKRSGRLVAVLYLDVDGFKTLNDRFGHHVGDTAISMIADRLRHTVRVLDAPARAYEGGDEFLVLCDDLSGAEEAYTIAERITSAVALPLEIPGAGSFRLTASVGIAFANPYDEPTAVVERADGAMLRAKRELGNRAPLADEGELVLDI